MDKYFITGGAGFIGSHLVDRLMSEGNRVTVYDNLISGKKEDIDHHLGEADFQFIQADILDFNTLKDAMKGHDIVWHLGANTDIPGGNQVTDLDLNNCTVGTYNTLEAMKQNDIKRILFASSATVYGDMPPVSLKIIPGPTGQESMMVGRHPVGVDLKMGMDQGPPGRGKVVLGDGRVFAYRVLLHDPSQKIVGIEKTVPVTANRSLADFNKMDVVEQAHG